MCEEFYSSDLRYLFLQEILRTHTKFVGKLEKGCNSGQISPVFLEFVSIVIVYISNCDFKINFRVFY